MTTAKARLLADLHSLVDQLERDSSDGQCLPDGLLRSLESELHAASGFMEKRRRKGPNRLAFSHSIAAKVGI